MIRTRDLNEEIKKLEDNIGKGVSSSSDVVKALCLVAKVIRDVRTNQVTIMKAQGIKLIESGKEDKKGGV